MSFEGESAGNRIFHELPVHTNVELARLTTWRVGGRAKFFCEPTAEQYPVLLERANELGIPVYFLGRGSNVLISDTGIDGLVLCTRRTLQGIWREGDYLVAEAGVPLPALSRFAANLGYGGYEFLIGIPGTVGGGIVVNAGLTSQGRKEIAERLVDVGVFDSSGSWITLQKSKLGMGYRTSALLDRGVFVAHARFRLDVPRSKEEIRSATANHLAERRKKQPLSQWTAGSTFKQPEDGRPAGWYIERAGLKGFRIGDAMVSEKHANWIENAGSATARDIKALIDYIRSNVADKFSVLLEREVRFLPEDQNSSWDSSKVNNIK